MRTRRGMLLCGLCVSVVALSAVAETQPSNWTIWNGVYSAAQAKRGEAAAKSKCTKCHDTDLAGGQDGPALVGPDVVDAWSSMTLRDLFERVNTTMPADAPRSLGAAEVADIVAYMLSLNKAPAGNEDLPADTEVLAKIRITRQQ